MYLTEKYNKPGFLSARLPQPPRQGRWLTPNSKLIAVGVTSSPNQVGRI